MANAKQCDRCKNLYAITISEPDIKIGKYTHGYGWSYVDLCLDCQSKLEKWLSGENELVEGTQCRT